MMAAENHIRFERPLPGAHLDLLQELSTAIIFCNSDLVIEFTNPAAQSLFQFSENQANGESVLGFLQHKDIKEILLRSLANSQATTLRRTELLSANRRPKLVDCILTPFQSEEASCLILEINEVNNAVRQLEEDTMEIGQHANSAVIRSIAHEIKNPLGGLRGAAQLLDRQLAKHPELQPYTEIIIRETDRLCGLVDGMSYTQATMRLEEINIHEVLEHVYRLALAEVHGTLKIVRDYDPSLPLVLGDREQLIQAFVNMMRNAIEACEASGRITLRTRVERQVTLGKTRYLSAARIDIEDDGCGIPDEIVDQVFYPMISGKPKGEGLGLSIVHQIIARHSGSISCESRPGRTCFTTILKFAGSNGCGHNNSFAK